MFTQAEIHSMLLLQVELSTKKGHEHLTGGAEGARHRKMRVLMRRDVETLSVSGQVCTKVCMVNTP